MWYLILVTLFLVLFFLKMTTENFMPLNDKKDKLKYVPKEIPYSNFLIDLNNNFQSELNAVQPKSSIVDGGRNPLPFKQKALCDDKLNIQVQKNALNKAFDKVSTKYPDLLVFEGDKIKNVDPEAYINDLPFKKAISDENKFSDNWYNSKIDPNLKIQNKTKIIQDIKFQDDTQLRDLKDDLDPCVYKANSLSEYTNPRLYLSSDKTRFPPRWIFPPYKNIPLPKTTNLKLWTDMYNCCENNF
jgi:hypothetical protein